MAKIIKIEDNMVSIGMPDGSIKVVHRTALDFEPHVRDEVDVFGTDEAPVILKTKNTYAQASKPVNKIAYCLLAFFLGGLGIHKFYAGKTGLGILYLLFCWTFIPGFIALIEFIIGLTKPADDNGNIIL
ncbi:TM2 domain-containing protein [Histophilus somni]|uniref:TM2 domain-containing protein n=1 Tax=Histophilus somni TaxID=731 RepID=UPI0024BDBF29|nr:TM2 domain-containing protein [Histophilus somni]